MLFVDVAGITTPEEDAVDNGAKNNDDDSSGLSCPPAAFVNEDALQWMRHCLTPRGVMAFNLVTRDQETAVRIQNAVTQIFPGTSTLVGEEDINRVLVCPSANTRKDERLETTP